MEKYTPVVTIGLAPLLISFDSHSQTKAFSWNSTQQNTDLCRDELDEKIKQIETNANGVKYLMIDQITRLKYIISAPVSSD